MKGYTQLNQEQRYQIYGLHKAGWNQTRIILSEADMCRRVGPWTQVGQQEPVKVENSPP